MRPVKSHRFRPLSCRRHPWVSRTQDRSRKTRYVGSGVSVTSSSIGVLRVQETGAVSFVVSFVPSPGPRLVRRPVRTLPERQVGRNTHTLPRGSRPYKGLEC